MKVRAADSYQGRPDRHEVRTGRDGLVQGLHLGRAYAINARGAFNAGARRPSQPGGFLAHDLDGRAPIPDPAQREDCGRAPPSDLVAFLERVEPTPSSLAAAAAIRRMAGPLAETGGIDALLPTWGFHDVRALGGLDPAARALVSAEARTLGRAMPWGAARRGGLDLLRGLVPPNAPRPPDEARLRRILAGPGTFSGEPELRATLGLPDDWRPRDASGRAALAGLSEGYARLAGLLGGYGFLTFARGRHAEAAGRLHPEGVPAQADGGVLDLVDALDGQLVRPALVRLGLMRPGPNRRHADAPSRHVAAGILFGDKGLPAILEAARRWHDSPLSQLPDVPNLAWDPPGRDLAAPNGARLAWLTSSAQLAAEGGRLVEGGLQHCVAGYAGKCVEGRCAILSIRGDEGRRLSTVEISLRRPVPDGPVTAEVVQHRGQRNLAPPDAAVEALAWFAGRVEAGDIRLDLPDPRRGAAGDGDPREAIAAWAAFLPRYARTPDGFDRTVLAAADALVRARWAGGWTALEAGRILPEAGTPVERRARTPFRWARLHPARAAAEALATFQAIRGRLPEAGTPSSLMACAAASLCLLGFGAYTTLFHLCLSLAALDGAGHGPLPPLALVASALSAAGIALAMPAAFLASAAILSRWVGALSLNGRLARARRHVVTGGLSTLPKPYSP